MGVINLASRSNHSTPEERARGTQWIEDWVSQSAKLLVSEKGGIRESVTNGSEQIQLQRALLITMMKR
jgi:hypothetical protein